MMICSMLQHDDSKEDKFRHAVLDALDHAAYLCGMPSGWTDQDLPELFRAIDSHRERLEARK